MSADTLRRAARGVDLHAMAGHLGCEPDLVSIREALEEVARSE